jgi:hypothetical protein
MDIVPTFKELAVNFTVIALLSWAVARRRASLEVPKLAAVVAGWWIGGILVSLYVTPSIGWASVLLTHAVLAALLMLLCYTSVLQAIVVVAAFAVIKVGLDSGWSSILNAEIPQMKAQMSPEHITAAERK